jgi:hypothetical protein
MFEIAGAVMRSVITDDEFGGFRITIRPSVRTQIASWGGVAICVCGMIFTVRSILSSPSRLTVGGIKPLGIWLAVGMFICFLGMHNGLFREVIKIAGKSLVLRKEFGFLTSERIFEVADVRNLRPIRWNDGALGMAMSDRVGFDYMGRTYQFGARLSEQEVLRLIKTIRLKVSIREDWSEVEPLPVVK